MKIYNVKNVGCIDSIDETIDLGKTAFIYGLNGAGKSTIKTMFTESFKESGKLAPNFSSTPAKMPCQNTNIQ